METKEYQAFKRLYDELQTGIRSGISDVTRKAFSSGLIPPPTKRKADNLMLNEDERAGIVLDAVLSRIKNVPNEYHIFAQILEDIRSFKYLAEEMRNELTRFENQPNNQMHQVARNWKWITIIGSCSMTVIVATWVCFSLIGNERPFAFDYQPIANSPGNKLLTKNDHEKLSMADQIRVDLPYLHGGKRNFVGRKSDLKELMQLLSSRKKHIININGPPAFGKSTLATKLGELLHKEFKVDVLRIDRKTVTTPDEPYHLCDIALDAYNDYCVWSYRPKEWTILILDDMDHVLESDRRSMFIDLIQHRLEEGEASAMSVIITTQERLEFSDLGFYSWPLKELEPTASVALLRQYVPQLSDEYALNFSDAVGHCPLALKVLGKLLSKKRTMNKRALLNELRKHVIPTISDGVTDPNEKFKAVMDIAYEHLDPLAQNCSRTMSLFPGTFDKNVGTAIIKDVVSVSGSTCLYEVCRKSLTEETTEDHSSKGRYGMHKLIREYFMEMKSSYPDNFNETSFNVSFRHHYSTYFLDTPVYVRQLHERHNMEHIIDIMLTVPIENLNINDVTTLTYLLHSKRVNLKSEAQEQKVFQILFFHIDIYFEHLCKIFSEPKCVSIFDKAAQRAYSLGQLPLFQCKSNVYKYRSNFSRSLSPDLATKAFLTWLDVADIWCTICEDTILHVYVTVVMEGIFVVYLFNIAPGYDIKMDYFKLLVLINIFIIVLCTLDICFTLTINNISFSVILLNFITSCIHYHAQNNLFDFTWNSELVLSALFFINLSIVTLKTLIVLDPILQIFWIGPIYIAIGIYYYANMPFRRV